MKNFIVTLSVILFLCSTGYCQDSLTVTPEGDIGIRTSSPTSALDVNGSIKGKDITFTSSLKSPVNGKFGKSENGSLVVGKRNAWVQVEAPIGTIIMWAGATPPADYKECRGDLPLPKTEYPELYSVLGSGQRFGDTATTFNLPEMRGMFVRGVDNGRGIDPDRDIGSDQPDQIKKHNHGFYHGRFGSDQSSVPTNASDDADGTRVRKKVTESYGSSETRPRNIALMYCIKYR